MKISKKPIGAVFFAAFLCAWAVEPAAGQSITSMPSTNEIDKQLLLSQGRSISFADKLAAADSVVPILVEFKQPINAKALKDMGVEISEKYGKNTWVAIVNPEALKNLSSHPYVADTRPFPKQAKRSSNINLKKPFEWQKRDKGLQAFSVLFHKGTSPKQVQALVGSINGARLENFDSKTFHIVRISEFIIAPEQLEELLDADIVQWVEPSSPPVEDENLATAQPLSNVDDVQIAPYNLSGNGITVGIWESGDVVDTTPLDLAGRVIVQAGQIAGSDDHAVHVAGTIGASGANVPNAEGMAPNVTMASWDSTNDANELTAAALSTGGLGQPTPIVASNHSYAVGRGWNNAGTVFTNDQNVFGQYTNLSQAFDNIVAQTGLIIVKAAGNERNDAPAIPVAGQPGDCFQGGFGVAADCISDRGTAKNIITVGAMNGPGGITTFTSYGPTDDGRIKPDLMAEGNNMLSLACNCFDDRNGDGIDDIPNSTTATRFMGGTSMSTPVVTGVSALLLEEANNLGITITAEGMKAIMIQTAQDVNGPGQSTLGPDYSTGWGIVDAQAAADLLRLPAGPGLAQETLTNTGMAGAYTQSFYLPGGLPEAHVTLAWVDPAGNPALPGGIQLVNDLDLRLIAPNDTVFTPWTLNPAAPGNAAVRNGGDDAVNNVEQVSVLNPMEGVWTLRVTAKAGSLAGGPQNFAVAGPFNPTSGPIASTKANIMLVMDRSGSMVLPSATGSLTKLDALQSAATELVDFIEIVGGHNMGLVQFDTNVAPFVPPFDLQQLDGGSAPNARARIGGMSIGNMTNIIDGVTEGQNQLSSPAATNDENIIVLFSDGRHNRPIGSDVADIDTVMDASTRFYGIGFGTDVDSSVMPGVASNHNGLYFEEQTLSAGQLSKLFLTVGGLSVNEDVVIDPDYPLGYLDTAVQSVKVNKADKSITFGAHWDTPNPNQMSFVLQGPDRKCRIALKDHQGLKTRAGEHYRLVRVELPYVCEKTGQKIHEGEWRLLAKNYGSTDTVKITVLADTDFRLNTKVWGKGGIGYITANFSLEGKPFITDAKLMATLTTPLPSTGDSERQDMYGKKYPYYYRDEVRESIKITELAKASSQLLQLEPKYLQALPLGEFTYLDKFQLQEATKIEETLSNVILVDDGTMGDKEAGDGIYTARVQLPDKGLYQIRISAFADLYGREVTRESLQSLYSH